jgi:ankyrin repeat protein
MTSILRITLFFFCLFFTLTAHAQYAYFRDIKNHKAISIEARLKRELPKGKVLKKNLVFTLPEDTSKSLSVILVSVAVNCRECLDAFLAQREKLEPYLNVQEELNKSLVFAMNNNNISLFDYLLQQGADINYECKTCYNRSMLLMVLYEKKYALFFKLMNLGANPLAIDSEGRNAFHALLMYYRKSDGVPEKNLATRTATIIQIIDTLGAKGVSVQQKDHEGVSLLMNAAYTDDAEVFDRMKSKGATIQLDNKMEVVTLLNHMLFSHPGQPNLSDHTLFTKVVNDYQIPLTKELFDTQDLFKSYSIIHVAYADNNPKMFDLLMDLHVDVNVIDQYGNIAINEAILNGNAHMCDRLLSEGATLDEHTGEYKIKFAGNTELLQKFKLAKSSK